MVEMAHRNLDGLPFLKMVDLSMAMLNNQMVMIWCQYAHMRWIQMQRSVRRRKQPDWFGPIGGFIMTVVLFHP